MGNAYVYVQYITGTCIRANVYIFNAPEADSAYMYTCKVYYGHMYTCEDIYILWLIIYYLILLNLTLANPHTELAMARLSSPANTTTISNNSTPGVVKTKNIILRTQPYNQPPPPHPSFKIQTARAKTRGKHTILPLNSREPKHGDMPETSLPPPPLLIFSPTPLPPSL